jgi:hypothetical protein
VSHWHVSSLLLSAALSLCGGAEPPVRVPDAPAIPDPMPPAPRPVPGAPLTLTPGVWFVVDSDVPVIVLASPEGLVSVAEDAGPLRFRGRFVEDPEKVQTRTFAGKHIYTIEAKASGRVEVLVVPVGASKAADVIRRTVMVEAGDGPIPPPKPKPDPKPDPKPGPVTSFRVIFVYESADLLTLEQKAVIYAKPVAEYLNAHATREGNQPGWRALDKDAAGADLPANLKSLWAAVKPKLTAVPCWVVEVNGMADILPLPANPADAVAELKKYRGDK